MGHVERDLVVHECEQDREETRDQAIESRMEQSMSVGEAYHPMIPINAEDAVGEQFILWKQVCELIDSDQFEIGGKLLKELCVKHWKQIAYEDAVYEVDNPDEDDFDEPDREWP